MDVSLHKKDDLTAVITIQMGPDDYKGEVAKELETYRKKMTLPGFRPGKAPIGLVRRHIGRSVVQEAVEKKVREALGTFTKEQNLKLLMQVLPDPENKLPENENTDVTLRFEAGLRPEVKIDPSVLEGLTLQRVNIAEADVEREVENLKRQNAKVDKAESVEAGEYTYLQLKFTELDDNGEPLEGGFDENRMASFNDLPETVQQQMEGRKAEESFDITLLEAFTPEQAMNLLRVDAHTLEDFNSKFRITISQLYLLSPPEENQELFDSLFEEGSVTTSEDFRSGMRQRMENYYNQKAEDSLLESIRQSVMNNIEVPLPEDFIRKYIDDMTEADEKGRSAQERMEDWRDELKWMVIAETLEEEAGIEVKEEELIGMAKAVVRQMFLQNGYTQEVPEETLAPMAMNYLSKENNAGMLRMRLRDMKVLQYLRSRITPVETEVGVQEFDKANPDQ